MPAGTADDYALTAVRECLAAAADLAEARTGRRPVVDVDPGHVAAAVRGEKLLRDPQGRAVEGFAPLSRWWPAADGWVRTHANYPWHREALHAALGADVGAAIARLPAFQVEQEVYGQGGLAVAARQPGDWTDPEPDLPLVHTTPLHVTQPRAARAAGGAPGVGTLPAGGLRVLDLTRVIAGPVATRMLAALGADVLRLDPPHRPELPLHAVDGTVGKASALLDAGTAAGRDTLHRLLAGADVLVTGYRPGALRRLGLAPDQVAERHPGTVVVTVSAWGSAGVWGTRRGFDSLVQAATGLCWRAAAQDGPAAGRPGALPFQLLDHATGYLAAAGALRALTERHRTGFATHVELSLARTARWVSQYTPGLETMPSAEPVPLGGGWTGAGPPGSLDGAPLRWPRPASYGSAAAGWS